jgi:fumarylacetoacetase
VTATTGGFGPEHLPYGVFRAAGQPARVGARLGDGVLDLAGLAAEGLLEADPALFDEPSLNAFMAAGPATWAAVRERLAQLASAPDAEPRLLALDELELLLPFEVADYVDFSSSLEHATNAGRLLRPQDPPLVPNWLHLPVAYHGRAGTVVVSGTPVRRPRGQGLPAGADEPVYGPSDRLDIELELGFVIGRSSALGEPVPIERALDHVFGVVLLNDWSARDLQAWESRPLGPFTGKSFATSIAAWVTPLAALEGRRLPNGEQRPAPPPYLREEPWGWDIDVEIELDGTVVSRTNARHVYWSLAQQIAHATVNGASLRVGDLLGTGAISGPEPGQRGTLLELSWNGAEPIALDGGATRAFLQDGDEVVLRGRAGTIELAEVRGRVEPAPA